MPQYGPVSYYTLGWVYPREQLRQPFHRTVHFSEVAALAPPPSPPPPPPSASQFLAQTHVVSGLYYGPISYYTLGWVYPRERLRQPFPRRVRQLVLFVTVAPPPPPSLGQFVTQTHLVSGFYYGPISYYTLGWVYPRERLRQPFPRRLRQLIVFVYGTPPPPPPPPPVVRQPGPTFFPIFPDEWRERLCRLHEKDDEETLLAMFG